MASLDKYSRSRYFPNNNIDGIIENDLAFSGFAGFVFNDAFTFYTLTEYDLQRPDLISSKLYNRQNFWWILMKLNNVCDIWNDLKAGDVFSVPSESDVQALIIYMQKQKRLFDVKQ